MKGKRYIFTTYSYLEKIRFSRLRKVCNKIFIVASKEDKLPIKLVKKAHAWKGDLNWYVVNLEKNGDINNRLSYLLGKQDQKAKDNVEFILLSDDLGLNPIISSLKAAGRSILRIGSSVTTENEEEPIFLFEPLVENKEQVEEFQPIPISAFRPTLDENEVVQHSARRALQKLQNEGHRPENLETLKHYIHLSTANSIGERASIDQVLEYMEAHREIKIEHGVVKYNF